MTLTGRDDDPADHGVAKYEIGPLRLDAPPTRPGLPVAALPTYDEELFLVQRAKKRPALVLSLGGLEIAEPALRTGPAWQTAPMMLIAPYFGIGRSTRRSGWNPILVERIRRCAYPQYLWDILPSGYSPEGSILRLDSAQPLSVKRQAFQSTRFRLSEEAVQVVTEWYSWLVSGAIPSGGLLEILREGLFGQVPTG